MLGFSTASTVSAPIARMIRVNVFTVPCVNEVRATSYKQILQKNERVHDKITHWVCSTLGLGQHLSSSAQNRSTVEEFGRSCVVHDVGQITWAFAPVQVDLLGEAEWSRFLQTCLWQQVPLPFGLLVLLIPIVSPSTCRLPQETDLRYHIYGSHEATVWKCMEHRGRSRGDIWASG